MSFREQVNPPLLHGGQGTDHLSLMKKVGLSQLESRLTALHLPVCAGQV